MGQVHPASCDHQFLMRFNTVGQCSGSVACQQEKQLEDSNKAANKLRDEHESELRTSSTMDSDTLPHGSQHHHLQSVKSFTSKLSSSITVSSHTVSRE